MRELAIPMLPMSNAVETRNFYEALGFSCAHEQPPPDSFLIITRGTVHLQFIEYPVNPYANYAGCVICTPNIDAWHSEFTCTNVAKVHPIEVKHWGTREFAFFDPSGNSIRVQELQFDI